MDGITNMPQNLNLVMCNPGRIVRVGRVRSRRRASCGHDDEQNADHHSVSYLIVSPHMVLLAETPPKLPFQATDTLLFRNRRKPAPTAMKSKVLMSPFIGETSQSVAGMIWIRCSLGSWLRKASGRAFSGWKTPLAALTPNHALAPL
jgi:hypothetical protein